MLSFLGFLWTYMNNMREGLVSMILYVVVAHLTRALVCCLVALDEQLGNHSSPLLTVMNNLSSSRRQARSTFLATQAKVEISVRGIAQILSRSTHTHTNYARWQYGCEPFLSQSCVVCGA